MAHVTMKIRMMTTTVTVMMRAFELSFAAGLRVARCGVDRRCTVDPGIAGVTGVEGDTVPDDAIGLEGATKPVGLARSMDPKEAEGSGQRWGDRKSVV